MRSLCSHNTSDILRNINRWLNDIYKYNHSHDLEKISSCTTFKNVEIYRPDGK